MAFFALMAVTAVAPFGIALAGDVPLMTKEELKDAMGSEDVLVLDVRAGRDWSASEFKITGAVRVDPRKVDAWAGDFARDRSIVLYCA
jgi:rhodanese-related sulfurtransferase